MAAVAPLLTTLSMFVLAGGIAAPAILIQADPVMAAAEDEEAEVDTLQRQTSLLLRENKPGDAEAVARRALTLSEQFFGENHRLTALSLHNLGVALRALGRLDEAEQSHRRALSIRERVLSENDADIAITLNEIGVVLWDLGRLEEAASFNRRALSVFEQAKPANEPSMATTLSNHGQVLAKLNNPSEAEQMHRRALAIRERILPPNDLSIAFSANELGLMLWQLRRLDEAAQFYRRALEIYEQAGPASESNVATTINNLGLVLAKQNRLDEAERMHRRALAIRERILPADHADIALSLSSIAIVLATLNRIDEAEELFQRALAIWRKTLPENDPTIALCLYNLGEIMRRVNRLEEAEAYLRQALAMREQLLPEQHPDLAASLNSLGLLLFDQYRYKEAEPFHRRALAIRESVFQENHLDIAESVNNLAILLGRVGKLDEAAELHRRSLAIHERSLPADHPDIAQSLSNLAETLRLLKQYKEAEALQRRALTIREKSLPADHPLIAESVSVLAMIKAVDNPVEADALYSRALAILERSLPPDHVKISETLENWALFSIGQGKLEQSLDLSYKASAIRSAEKNRSRVNWRWLAALQADVADRMIQRGDKNGDVMIKARRAAFQNLQWERARGTGGAIASATARAQAADPKVAVLARERDRVSAEIERLDQSFLVVSSAEDSDRATRAEQLVELRNQAAAARERLSAIDVEIAKLFPAFSELSGSAPVAAADLMPLIADDEVLVSITPFGEWGFFYGYSATAGSFAWLREAGTAGSLAAKLRCSAAAGLDPSCSKLAAGEAAGPTRSVVALADIGSVSPGVFDLDLAYDLYRRMFPDTARKFIEGKKLIIVPAPELMGLPWHLLVTEPPPKGWNDSGADLAKAYREAKWLFQSHASISVLPSVNSLRAFRSSPGQRKTAERAFLGVGDPVIGRSAEERDAPARECGEQPVLLAGQQPTVIARSAAVQPKELFLGERDAEGFVLADPELVRAQPRLADTRCELATVAASISRNSGKTDLLLGADASEKRIREMNEEGGLERYGVIQFATHGLLGGELGLGEPGLVLTPPEKATASDDGILTASEIATLNLAADWVVLSACNTAAGGDANTEALSGLARSFFYAGAKSLLVSSWPVYSSAAVDITTRTFGAMERNSAMGRAEALTLAMRGMLDSANSGFAAHPAYWAPFLLVGEGAR